MDKKEFDRLAKKAHLESLCCPKCYSFGPFDVSVGTYIEIGDGGSYERSEGHDYDYDGSSDCTCKECNHSAELRRFSDKYDDVMTLVEFVDGEVEFAREESVDGHAVFEIDVMSEEFGRKFNGYDLEIIDNALKKNPAIHELTTMPDGNIGAYFHDGWWGEDSVEWDNIEEQPQPGSNHSRP